MPFPVLPVALSNRLLWKLAFDAQVAQVIVKKPAVGFDDTLWRRQCNDLDLNEVIKENLEREARRPPR